MKRSTYISWDEYFMWIALLSSYRSKDPSTQVGACIVNANKRIVWIGYNGFPIGCNDDDFPWGKSEVLHESKYAYVVHAEANAILNSMGRDLEWSTLYVALYPCNECMKLIIQSGIKHVKYLLDANREKPYFLASKKMAEAAGVITEKIQIKSKNILIDFENYTMWK